MTYSDTESDSSGSDKSYHYEECRYDVVWECETIMGETWDYQGHHIVFERIESVIRSSVAVPEESTESPEAASSEDPAPAKSLADQVPEEATPEGGSQDILQFSSGEATALSTASLIFPSPEPHY